MLHPHNKRQTALPFPFHRRKENCLETHILVLSLLLNLLLFSTNTLANNSPPQRSALPGIIVISGQQAAPLLHQPIASIRIYAFRRDHFEPIPFQIDERDQRDRWVLDHGPQAKPDDSAGAFDDNDVIILMHRDLGQPGDSARLPKNATAWAEIRIGSSTAPVGFAYIGIFTSAAPETTFHRPYTQYDPQADFVLTNRYTLGFAGAPLPSHLAFVEQLGESGTNLIAGVRVIGEVRFLHGLLTLRRTDQDIHTEVLGYRHGPIRTIRRARYWIPLPLGLRTNGRIDVLFYRDVVEGTTVVRLKVPPRLILADGEVRAYFRFLDLSGARLIVEGYESTATVDGHMDESERVLHLRPARWAALALPNGRALLLIARLEGALQRLEQRLYFNDGDTNEAQADGKPFFGFEFSRVNQLETGTHRLSVFAIALDSARVEDIRRTVEQFLTPPEVSVAPALASTFSK